MGRYERAFTILPTAKRVGNVTSDEVQTNLGLPGMMLTLDAVASDGVNAVQTITFDPLPDDGTWTITYDGQTTAALDYDADAAAVEAALLALSNIGATPDDVNVTGDVGAYVITFQNALAARAVPLLEVDTSDLVVYGDLTISIVDGGHTAAEADTQQVQVKATSGNFTLTYSGQTTGNINAATATAATVQAALEALNNIAPGDILVTGGPADSNGSWPFVITYLAAGALAASDVGVTATDVSLANAGEVRVDRTVEGNPNNNEVQVITKRAGTGGTFKLTFGDQETAAIAQNASAATVKTRLTDLSNIGASDVDVTGDAGGPWTVEFKGDLALAPQDLLVVSDNSLTQPDSVTAGQLMVGIAASTAKNEVVTVTVDATAGTYQLAFGGQATASIDFDATAAEVQTALEAISTIDVGDISVSGEAGGPYRIEFIGPKAYTNVGAVTGLSVVLTNNESLVATVEMDTDGEVAGTGLDLTVQIPDADGGWVDYVTDEDALADDGQYILIIRPGAAAGALSGAVVSEVAAPAVFRVLIETATTDEVWTYSVYCQMLG